MLQALRIGSTPGFHLSLGNMQFFSEEGTHPFAAEPTPEEAHPFADTEPSNNFFAQHAEGPNPLRQEAETTTPELQSSIDQGQEGQGSTTPAYEELDFGGRKVQMTDPVIGDLHKDYTNLNREFQARNQELVQSRQMNEQYQQMMNQQQEQTNVQQPQQGNQNETTPERTQQMQETYMEMMYEDKFAADKWWNEQPEVQAITNERLQTEVQTRLNEYTEPIRQERELQQQIQQLNETHSDFGEYTTSMQEIIDANPEFANMPNALETVFYMAKGKAAQSQPTREQLLSDPSFQQEIYNNETIRNQIMQNYSQQKTQSNQGLPKMMGTNPGSQTPMSAGESAPKTLREATAAYRRYTGQK